MTWWMYVVECSDGSLYCGVSPDVTARVKKHNTGKGAKYTRGRTPVRLLATWPHPNRSTAQAAEYRFKKLKRSDKLALIRKQNGSNQEAAH
mgnify:FL=1